jgi:Family of unknown function (DUF5372)
MNLFFLERKGGGQECFPIFTSARSPAATSARPALATHRQPPLTTAPRRFPAPWPAHYPQATIEIDPWKAACNSIQNANTPIAATRLVRITHPFHPLSGKQLACVGERYNRYGRRLLFRVDDVTVCSVPPQWTDLVAPDPEIVIGEYRALFRVADLLELERLVDQLRKRDSWKKPDDA